MKIVKVLVILVVAYVSVVVIFESSLGYFQPQNDNTLILVIANDDGEVHQRVLSRIEVAGQVYVAVNHWPRKWYYQVLEHPNVSVIFNNTTEAAIAVQVSSDEEAARISAARPSPLMFRVLTGFPPRYFVRLDGLVSQPIKISAAVTGGDVQ